MNRSGATEQVFDHPHDADATMISAAEQSRGAVALDATLLGNCRPAIGVVSAARKQQVKLGLLGDSFARPVRIGRFDVLEAIGQGGMGQVLLAYDKQLARQVAIKLVRPELDEKVRADDRSLREAQTLARLSHPNVVQVYEAGTFRGQVFIAMEYIRGQTLREWLHENPTLTGRARVREVLRLFLGAGRGLEAAHQAELMHRDFKPENVLIGEDGRPRVVDFGLARLESLHNRPGDAPAPRGQESGDLSTMQATMQTLPMPGVAAEYTRPGQVLGTPGYMSPEQMRGKSADRRSDQFSFCVALYEALYGTLPFAQSATLEEIEQAVKRGRLAERKRGVYVPATLRKVLVRGLSIDPADRFPDMGALLDALARWPGQRRQRLGLGIAMVSLLATGIATFPAATPQPAAICADAARPMDALWSSKRKHALAHGFAAFDIPYAQDAWRHVEQQIDDYAMAWQQHITDACEATHVRHVQSEALLDRRMQCLDQGRRRLAALLDELDQPDAGAIERAGSAAADLPALDACMGDAVPLVAPPRPDQQAAVAAIRDGLARSRTQLLLGRTAALRLASEQLALAENLDHAPVHAEALVHTGMILVHGSHAEDIARGEQLLEQASNMAEAEHHDTIVAEARNALVFSAYRNHPGSERGYEWSRRAMAAIRRLGDPPGLRASALRDLGLLFFKDNQFATAEQHMRDAIALLEQDGSATPITWAEHLHSLARTLRYRGQLDEARTLYERALSLLGDALGEQHPRLVEVRFGLAVLHLMNGRLDDARVALEAVLASHRRTMGPGDALTGKAHLEMAEILRRLGDLGRAREHAGQGLAIYEQTYGSDHPRLADAHIRLGAIEYRRGHLAEALAAYERALAIQSRHKPPGDFDIGLTHANIAEVHAAQARTDDALAAVERARAILALHFAAMPEIEAFLLAVRGRALLHGGEARQAASVLEAAVQRFDALPGDAMAMERADAYWALAQALDEPGDSARARALARDALAIYQAQGEVVAAPRNVVASWLRDQERQR